MKKLQICLGVILLISVLALSSQALANRGNDTMVCGITQEIHNVDKYFDTARPSMLVQRMVYDGLLYINPDTFEVEYALATGYTYKDNLTVDFDLRKGVKFHDGSEFNADDAAYTLNYISNPENKVKAKRYANYIDRVEALDRYKVRIHLKKAFPPLLQYLGGPVAIYKAGCYDVMGKDGKKVGSRAQLVNPNGTGPYKITGIKTGKSITMVKNEDYFTGSPKGEPKIGKIILKTVPELSTQVAELMNGRLDWAFQVPTDQAMALGQNPKLTYLSTPSMRVGYLFMDAAGRTGDTPFKKLKVRQAVAHAINKSVIANNIMQGASQVIHAGCNPVQFGCTDQVKKYPYDPEKARTLLKEAGYPNGFKTLFYAYRQRPVAEAVIGDLKAVGIEVDFRYVKWGAIRSGWQKGEIPFGFTTWGSSSLADISSFTPIFFNQDADDLYRDDEVSRLMALGQASVDPGEREEAYHNALKIIAKKAYWVPMFTYNMNYVFSKDLDFPGAADGLPRIFRAGWKQ